MNKMKPTAQEKKALLYLFPAIALLAFFFIWPIALSFFYSMTDMTLSGTKAHNYDFVALDNFKRLFSDSLFRTSFVNTLVFLFGIYLWTDDPRVHSGIVDEGKKEMDP